MKVGSNYTLKKTRGIKIKLSKVRFASYLLICPPKTLFSRMIGHTWIIFSFVYLQLHYYYNFFYKEITMWSVAPPRPLIPSHNVHQSFVTIHTIIYVHNARHLHTDPGAGG